MDDDVSKAAIVIGAVGLTLILIITFWNEIYKVLKVVWDWIIYDVWGIDRFYGLQFWDWFWIIFVIAICICSCIFNIFSED